jgi:transglutaminase-like putative cysteine protease
MSLERRLQINLAIMTSLGSLLLAVAEGDARLGVLGVAVSASSVYFADVKRWLVLNALWSNVVGVLALVLTLVHWQTLEREMLFIALANFLTYLQCILHYRAKVQHVYGMLMLLSFLQMAVASVLASTVLFGVLLLAYLWFAVRTLSLFSILREREEARFGPGASLPQGTFSLAELFVTPVHRLALMLWDRLRGRGGREAPIQRLARWPLADRPSRLSARGRSADDTVVVRGLGRHVLKFGLLTLLLAPAVFVAIPRPGQRPAGFAAAPPGATALTGFSDRVMLRDVTRIRENPDEVMRITLTDYKNGAQGRAYEVMEQPWLRGTALGRYGSGGSWRAEEWSTSKLIDLDNLEPVVRDVLPDPRGNDLVLFEVTLERMRTTSVVFTLEPAYRVPGPDPTHLRREAVTDEHYRPRSRRNSTFTYQMLTTGLKGGRQVRFRPQDEPYDWRQRIELLEPFANVHEPQKPLPRAPTDPRWRVLEQQHGQLKGLADVAARALVGAGLNPRQNPREAALALERYLHHEGNYSYSLNPPPRKAAGGDSDPVNDFVVQGKVGHCEYFASALALMLRSQGIPSRLVVGYKGGEWNALGGYYEVRQSDAHAWVEAWIFQDGRPLGWLRLDPTPGEGVPIVQEPPRWKQASNYLHFLWSRYVMGMDANLQEELVQPLAKLFQRKTWEAVLQWVLTALAGEGWSEESFNWRACLVVIGAQLLLVGLYKLLRVLLARLGAWRRHAALRRRGIPYVEFYARLERLLQRCGLCRRQAQTPWEFAADSAGALAASPLTVAAAPLLAPIVEAYYRVRFGGPPLTEAERQSLAEELTRLEAIVAHACDADQ